MGATYVGESWRGRHVDRIDVPGPESGSLVPCFPSRALRPSGGVLDEIGIAGGPSGPAGLRVVSYEVV